MSKSLPTVIVALVIVGIIIMMMCAYQVRFTETAVVTRFDQIKDVIEPESAGLHYKLPWPIERVHHFDTRLRSFDTEFRQIGTEDQKTVVLTAYATWRIKDGRRFLEAVGREDAASAKIRDLLENQVQVVLRTHPLSSLVNIKADEMKFAEIEREFLHGSAGANEGKGIQETALKNYGIEIVSVGIKRLGLPESVTKDVFTRMKEDRQKSIKELTAEGEAKAKEIRVGAEQVAQKILARAEAYAKTIQGQGDAEAAKYYSVFSQNRQLSEFLKMLESVERMFRAGQMTLVLDAERIIPFNLLKEVGNTPEPTKTSQANNAPAKLAGRSADSDSKNDPADREADAAP